MSMPKNSSTCWDEVCDLEAFSEGAVAENVQLSSLKNDPPVGYLVGPKYRTPRMESESDRKFFIEFEITDVMEY
jgi:hypothetical protein